MLSFCQLGLTLPSAVAELLSPACGPPPNWQSSPSSIETPPFHGKGLCHNSFTIARGHRAHTHYQLTLQCSQKNGKLTYWFRALNKVKQATIFPSQWHFYMHHPSTQTQGSFCVSSIQWDVMLHFNIISHWLGTNTKWSLRPMANLCGMIH